jgi:hypothetical protein
MWFQWLSLVGLILFTTEFMVQFVLNAIPGTNWYQLKNINVTSGLDLTPLYDMRGQVSNLILSLLDCSPKFLVCLFLHMPIL